MRFCRFDEGRLGLVEGTTVRDVTAALDVLPRFSYPLPQHDIFIANLDAVATRARALAKDAPALPLDGLTLLSPVANPGKIIAAPVNYQKHLNEVRDNPSCTATIPATRSRFRAPVSFSKRRARWSDPGKGSLCAARSGALITRSNWPS
jgi:2-keto-4-pentenoate hydratase/2-oxohepta-3-ene-1,7-dioic acid hydratase in catechol pathway